MALYKQAIHFNTKKFQVQKKTHYYVTFDNQYVDPQFPYLVLKCSLPSEKTEVTTEPYFNQQVKVAGFTSFDDCNLEIRDVIGLDGQATFQKWRNQVNDAKRATMGNPEDYKATGTLVTTDPAGNNARTWILIGCFPATVNYGDLEYGSSDDVHITIGMSYDWGYRESLQATDKHAFINERPNGVNSSTVGYFS